MSTSPRVLARPRAPRARASTSTGPRRPLPMDEAGAVASLGALAQAMRLRIYRTLIGAGPQGLTPGVLAATLDVPASTLSFHLKELMQAGLVSQERDGRHLIYRPSLDRMNTLLSYLTAHCCEASDGADCGLGPSPGCSSC